MRWQSSEDRGMSKPAPEQVRRQAVDEAFLAGRRAFARDLHDSFGGHLISAIARLEQNTDCATSGETLALLKELQEDLRRLMETDGAHLHKILASPAVWLAPVRRRYGELLEEAGIQTHWELPPTWPWPLSPPQAASLLRILQEGCTNVLKHSRASRLVVILDSPTDDSLHLSIEDNGIGFDAKKIAGANAGMGLASIAIRAKRLGGQLQIHSGGGATRIRVSLSRYAEMAEETPQTPACGCMLCRGKTQSASEVDDQPKRW